MFGPVLAAVAIGVSCSTAIAADLPPVPLITTPSAANGSSGKVDSVSTVPASPSAGTGDETIDSLAPGRLTPVGGSEWGQDPVALRPVVSLSSGSTASSTPFSATGQNKRPTAAPAGGDPTAVTAQATGFDPLSPIGLTLFGTVMLCLFGAGWYVVRRR
jgi:hypothetical protein